jgi:cysteine synthase A
MLATSALGLIGGTPLVRLGRAHAGPGAVYAKAELLNPGGSVKDRAALGVIDTALRTGALSPGQRVVEMTSGNMGAGLALVCAARGHPFTAMMSAGNSPTRARMMAALGAEVVIVPQVDGEPGRVTGADIRAAGAAARAFAADTGAWFVDQFNNPGVVAAHFDGTGPEIVRDLPGVTAFVAAVGTGGTFLGVSAYLKSVNPGIMCVAVEPEGAQILAGRTARSLPHLIQGIGYGEVPPLWDPTLMDLSIGVSDEDAVRWQARLATTEGLFVGFSAAANVCAAGRMLTEGTLPRDSKVVTVLCDTGLKYG